MYDPRSDLEQHDHANPRHQQVTLGPSDSGGCRRQHAYAHHGTTKTDTERSEAEARLGSLLHLGYARVTEALGRDANVNVAIPGLHAPGHADDVDFANRIVRDLKTTKDRVFKRWITYGLPERMWQQVELYAYGLWLTDPEGGDWTLAILLLNRETGQEVPFERPADPDNGQRLAQQLAHEQQILDASDSPDDFPRDGHGPGSGMPCDWCPWLTACWGGPVGALSPQAATIAADPVAVGGMGREYLDANAAVAKAAEQKATARLYLTGIPAGDYDGIHIGWQGGNPRGPQPDPVAMARRLAELGEPVPTVDGGTTTRSIRVPNRRAAGRLSSGSQGWESSNV